MTRKSKLAGALAVTAALGVAGSAVGEPSHTTKPFGNGYYTEKWEGTGSGSLATQDAMDEAGCQPGVHDCYDTLIQVLEPGTLTVKTTGAGATTPANDTDLQLFASNDKGEVKEELAESAQATPTSDEQVSVRVKVGYYIARIDYAICANCAVAAEATLKSSGPAPAAPGATPPAAGPGADQPPAVTAKKPGSKKVKAFSGVASDDKGVAKVEVGILQLGKKGKCKELNKKGKLVAHKGQCTQPNGFVAAKGTTKWSLKLKKALPKGKYVLFAKATDAAGQTQGGYGPGNKKAFTVKK